LIGRQILHVHVPARDSKTRRRDEPAEERVDARRRADRRVQRRGGEHDAERDHRDALKDAERARVEMQRPVLGIERVAHERRAEDEADGVEPSALPAR
jgi:hypothetical protein